MAANLPKFSLVLLLFSLCSVFVHQCHASLEADRRLLHRRKSSHPKVHPNPHPDTEPPPKYNKQDFFVNGTSIPGVSFTVPDSYAGVMPVNDDGSKGIFFWLQLAENDVADQELTIWIHGGGFSGLFGMLQEHGQWLLPLGGSGPTLNNYSWTQLSNVLYVDYPVGVGFSPGMMPNSSSEAAKDFFPFLVNFFDTFRELQGKNLYWSGNGYVANSVSYIMQEIFTFQVNNIPFNVSYQGFSMYNPSITNDSFTEQIPSIDYAVRYQSVLGLNDSFLSDLKQQAADKNLTNIVSGNLLYPPNPNGLISSQTDQNMDFDPWTDILAAAVDVNANFSFYNIDWRQNYSDPLGFPPPVTVLGPSTDNWINSQAGFKKAIHVNESVQWAEFTRPWNGGDDGDDFAANTGLTGGLINYGNKSIIICGEYAYNIIADGVAIFLQILPWSNGTGFNNPPNTPVLVNGTQVGNYTSERGLTFIRLPEVGYLTGFDAPSTAFAIQQYLYGQKNFG